MRSFRSILPLNYTVIAVASDFLGLREHGNNLGPGVGWFQSRGTIPPGSPWCAAFVNGVAEVASTIHDRPSPLEQVPLQGLVQSYYSYGAGAGWLREWPDVLPGDLFCVWKPGRVPPGYGHIGFVYDITGGHFWTLEGNSNDDGSAEGVEVVSNERRVTSSIAFLRWWE